jgi:hypothetical protein
LPAPKNRPEARQLRNENPTRVVVCDGDEETRVSLYPLDPVEALRAALQVDPNSEPVEDEG